MFSLCQNLYITSHMWDSKVDDLTPCFALKCFFSIPQAPSIRFVWHITSSWVFSFLYFCVKFVEWLTTKCWYWKSARSFRHWYADQPSLKILDPLATNLHMMGIRVCFVLSSTGNAKMRPDCLSTIPNTHVLCCTSASFRALHHPETGNLSLKLNRQIQ